MLQEFIGYFNSIKKTQAEIKVTLSEIKKTSQGISNGVVEAENQINDLEHEEEKKKQSEQEERIQNNNNNNKDSVRSFWDNFKCTNL